MAGQDDLRVSDEQRERAAAEIREHYAAGRLTDDELSERVQAAYSARTEQELRTALADLPKLPATPAQQKAELVARRSMLQRRMLQEAGGGMGVFALCTAIWAASGATGQFWPIWVLLVCLIPLIRNGWRLYGPSPDLERVERELETRRRRDQLRHQVERDVHGDVHGDVREDVRAQLRERRADRRSRRHGGSL